jgi:hypothetical protein
MLNYTINKALFFKKYQHCYQMHRRKGISPRKG